MLTRSIVDLELWDGRHVWSWGTLDGLPVFKWGHVPDGLLTLAQLHDHEPPLQRRRGQEPYAVLAWRGGRRTASLWRVDQAVPRQTFTPARRAALTLAYLANCRCRCGRELDYYARVHGCAECDGREVACNA